jgi:hypothetical protein
MTSSEKTRFRKQQANDYAKIEDFCGAFAKGMNELYYLSFLLTADDHKAEQCFVAGLEDSISSNRVFKEWARSWAKHAIIQNAIRIVMPRPPVASSASSTIPHSIGDLLGQNRYFKLDSVLALGDFDRFVFVMSVLEHYFDHDCAMLLGCSTRQIGETRIRVFSQLNDSLVTTSSAQIDFETLREIER